jgi:hypothetical protein
MKGPSDVLIPWHFQQRYRMSSPCDNATTLETSHPSSLVFQRYYHLFSQGELEQLVHKGLPYPTMNIANTTASYDHENWYVIIRKMKEF